MIALDPLGDRAFLARFLTVDEARDWAEAARATGLPGASDVVLAYSVVGVFAEERCDDLDGLADALRRIVPRPLGPSSGRLLTIPVLYDGEDLADVAERLNLGADEVIAIHSGRDYDVLAMGFLPGFPYAGDHDPRISGFARRDSPRPRVPRGSVAIAGSQTGIYPGESPGGWRLLGRTPLMTVDVDRGLFPIGAGDRLRFVAIGPEEYRDREGEWLGGRGSPARG